MLAWLPVLADYTCSGHRLCPCGCWSCSLCLQPFTKQGFVPSFLGSFRSERYFKKVKSLSCKRTCWNAVKEGALHPEHFRKIETETIMFLLTHPDPYFRNLCFKEVVKSGVVWWDALITDEIKIYLSTNKHISHLLLCFLFKGHKI